MATRNVRSTDTPRLSRAVFEALLGKEEVRRACSLLQEQLSAPIWCEAVLLEDTRNGKPFMLPVMGACPRQIVSSAIVRELTARAAQTNVIYQGRYPGDREGTLICVPITVAEVTSSFLIVGYHSGEVLPPFCLNGLQLLIGALAKGAEKECELERMCDSIRPRAIALSTVHTVHRLISSTLKIDDLIPRIARLSLQIMRSEGSAVFLLQQGARGKILPPVVAGSPEYGEARLSAAQQGMAYRCVRTGRIMLRARSLVVPLVDDDIIGAVIVWRRHTGVQFTESDKEILSTLAEQAVVAIRNATLYSAQEEMLIASVESIAALMGARSVRSHRLVRVLTTVAEDIGRKMGLTDQDLTGLRFAILLHDTTQVTVPDEILRKPTRLTGREHAMIRRHAQKGIKLIEPLKALRPAIPIIQYHHERYDGKGYPRGLHGDQIPVGARIMAVVCAFEAMIAKRPYRDPKTIDEALEEIRAGSRRQFCPQTVRHFLAIVSSREVHLQLVRGREERHGN